MKTKLYQCTGSVLSEGTSTELPYEADNCRLVTLRPKKGLRNDCMCWKPHKRIKGRFGCRGENSLLPSCVCVEVEDET